MKNPNALRVLVTALVVAIPPILPYRLARDRIWEITKLDIWYSVVDGRYSGAFAVDLKHTDQSLESTMKRGSRSWFDNHIRRSFCPVYAAGGRPETWSREKNRREEERINLGAEKNYHRSKVGQALEIRLHRHFFCTP